MKITDALLGEHGLFYPLFDKAAELAASAKSPAEIALLVELLAPAIETHSGLEDSLLFPVLAARGAAAGPVQVMRAEHREVDVLLASIPQERDLVTAQVALRRLIEILTDHFRKEEQVLFPMCETVLGDDELEAMGETWRKQRGI